MGWTPEQIVGRIELEQVEHRTSVESIYRHVYSPEGRRAGLSPLNSVPQLKCESSEDLSDRCVSRLLRLAWLAPDVLERLVVRRKPCAISLYDLCFVASLPWDEQPTRVFV